MKDCHIGDPKSWNLLMRTVAQDNCHCRKSGDRGQAYCTVNKCVKDTSGFVGVKVLPTNDDLHQSGIGKDD